MDGDRVWVVDDPDELLFNRKKSQRGAQPPRQPQKNPALAFTLSLLVWGAGQIYNRQRRLGLLFLLLMATFYLDLGLIWMYWSSITPSIVDYVTYSQILMGIGAFYFFGLVLWFFSAQHAYHRTDEKRTDPFLGIENRFLPALCSLLIPGWGQFLNGQAKKGGFFLIWTLIGFFSFPVLLIVPSFWSVLRTEMDRLFWEAVLVAVLFFSPLVLLIWPFSSFDALRVGLDETKKEPLLKRIEYANNRRRMRGWGEILADLKPTLLLALFLVFCLTVSYYYFPKAYYLARLQSLRIELSRQDMVLIPRLIDRFLHGVLKQG